MGPSSRTPEGVPNRCPVCGAEVCIEPSVPPGDAPCPCCGHLLWFDPRGAPRPSALAHPADQGRAVVPEGAGPVPPVRPWSDAAVWSLNGLCCGLVIGWVDQSPTSGVCWLAVCWAVGRVGLPALVRRAEQVSQRRRSFWLDVVLGWALIPGPLVGSAFGAVCPLLWQMHFTALQGAFMGLLVGPLLAPLEGLLFAALVVGAIWLATGERLDTE